MARTLVPPRKQLRAPLELFVCGVCGYRKIAGSLSSHPYRLRPLHVSTTGHHVSMLIAAAKRSAMGKC